MSNDSHNRAVRVDSDDEIRFVEEVNGGQNLFQDLLYDVNNQSFGEE